MSPSRWLPFLGVIFLLGSVLSVPWLSTLAVSVGVIIGLAAWWQAHALDEVFYRRRFHYTRGFPAETTSVAVEVENRKFLPLSWLRVQDRWPLAVAPLDETVLAPSHLPDEGLLTNLFSLRWFEHTQRRYEIAFRQRGVYRIGPARLQSGDLFGMYEQSRTLNGPDRLTVFPALLPLPRHEVPAQDPLGERSARRRLYEDPTRPMGVREYHPEDGLRRIHWPATARTGRLQVKVYQPTSGRVVVVCLNVATFVRHWEGVNSEMLERLISTAATLVTQSIEAGFQVGLISNGCISHSDRPFRIPPGSTLRQQAILLEALAGVSPVVVVPFERFLLREVPHLPYGASLVVVSAVSTPELSETLLRLKRAGRRISLVSLAAESPLSIPGITCFQA
ncbi:MAG: hypothetical protein Fur0018_04210 [Anaerolineales bacterium]